MDSFMKDYAKGDEVVTSMGLSPIGAKDVLFPVAVVDYAEIEGDDKKKSYDEAITKAWDENHFERGFSVDRLSDESARVSSKRRSLVLGFDKDGRHEIEAPNFWVDIDSNKSGVDDFFRIAPQLSVWLLMMQTISACHVHIIDWETGSILSRHKKPKYNFKYEPQE